MITYMQRMYFILIAYLLLGYYDSYAQPYLLKHLGVEDGLSNNYVTNITQDKQGYIWIATESGLSGLTDGTLLLTRIMIPGSSATH